MFDIESLIEECRRVAGTEDARMVVHGVLARAVGRPTQVIDALATREPGLHAIYRSSEITIVNVVWAPRMTIGPHDHNMWAVIAMYAGVEENTFWRSGPDGRLERAGGATLEPGNVRVLGSEVVHSVINARDRLAGALHVYGADFFEHRGRSEWDEQGRRQAWDPHRAAQRFDHAKRVAHSLEW